MTIYDEYEILNAQIDSLESKKDDLRAKILTDMVTNGMKQVPVATGKFSISKLKRWTYPEEVTKIGEEFKAAKAKAESTGEATYTEQDSLKFNTIKL